MPEINLKLIRKYFLRNSHWDQRPLCAELQKWNHLIFSSVWMYFFRWPRAWWRKWWYSFCYKLQKEMLFKRFWQVWKWTLFFLYFTNFQFLCYSSAFFMFLTLGAVSWLHFVGCNSSIDAKLNLFKPSSLSLDIAVRLWFQIKQTL